MQLARIAEILGCDIPKNRGELEITSVASLESAGEHSVSFFSNPKLRDTARASKAAAIIVDLETELEDKILLRVPDPYLGYARIAQAFEDSTPVFGPGIHPSVVVHSSARIAANASIGPLAVIGADCVVGEYTQIGAGCVIEKNTSIGRDCRIDSKATIRWGTKIGDRVIIQSGAVIGSDGFANAMDNGTFVRIPCFGAVVIEDDVQIGAGTTIDRGNFEPTILHRGVRLDNLIHIAHNVTVGEHTAMAAQVGISGSTRIGRNVIIFGQAGFVGHIDIGDKSLIGAKAGVSKDVPPGTKVTGCPARDFMKMRRIEAAQANLPELQREVKRLKARVEALSKNS